MVDNVYLDPIQATLGCDEIIHFQQESQPSVFNKVGQPAFV